jgi:hypothetical protein
MGMARKLEDVRESLTGLGEQGKVKGFLNNVENAEKLGGLLEDIRDAIMDYQVCTSSNCLMLQCLMFESDFVATRHLRQYLSAHRESHPFTPIRVE